MESVKILISENELKECLSKMVAEAVAAAFEKQTKHVGEFLTLEQAAQRLDIHRTTLWKWNRDNILPTQKIGGRTYVKLSDIENLLK